MDKFPFRRLTSLITVLTLACMVLVPDPAFAIPVKVPVGTMVPVITTETISPETHLVGQRVTLSAERDVIVSGKTVIAAGAMVVGEVTVSRKAGAVGAPGEIGIVLRTVTAADGSTIPIEGSKIIQGKSRQAESLVVTILCCVLGLIMKGDPADIATGSSIDARVLSEIEVEVSA